MKIYKEKENVTFVIGSKTFEGYISKNHVCLVYTTNYAVFDALNIPSKKEFCSKHYGYRADDGGWPECKSGDYEALSRLIHALQELCHEHNDKSTQEINVGDWVKCISHNNDWSTRFTIGKIYEVKTINSGSDFNLYCSDTNCTLWVEREDFVLCNPYEVQDDSGWKIGDKLQYIREGTYEMSLNDCTVGMIYTIVKMSRTLGYPVIIDDVEDTVSLSPEELKCFKKIINNQTTTINYVKDNSNTSFELPSSSPAISARQTPRGGIVSSSDLEIWI